MSLHSQIVPPITKLLTNVETWIDLAHEHASKKSFDPAVLLAARLAPDQFPLLKQLQATCDHGKFAAARVAGKDPPKHPDTEQTWDEIRARIRVVREYVASFTPADFEGAEQRIVPLSFMPGKALSAPDYLHHSALPNLYFHATTAYAILRHNGVDVGKRHFIGALPLRDL
ncbi:DUF1993 domain-containing protein [Sandaracinus amylolyticus]|uniref:DUF1993 domain-containing protein n=1 Tax=Sandaracinus amylolyticus TaxID=927083 RepID=A0A0F6YGD0_9BACT|nr:DUF1993 domain-containing protein [Sandaracinus amylolyticus]AKF04547.1 hypothetical protein DB32_001696 [Sandaracinus amylolyticus]